MKIYLIRCPVCGMVKRHKEGEDYFDPDNPDFLRVQEIGGKVVGTSKGKGGGKGSSKGRAETLESHPLDDLPDEYSPVKESLKSRLKGVLEELE